ncbi:transposase family protein [Hymenobacter sp. BRD67]|nr:DDE-type integrase/transposase/recombinase [Hymenobacter sp. BRD67]QKG51604.1 transposase family protein [Hymenobacter sp. BRD67]QKG53126.1 transposase family protein [Hymenobacter sp. BRD67]
MPEALVTTALQRALLAQRPAPGLIVHSDRGGQYVGNVYKALLRDAKAHLSHSRAGDCYDNAQAENRQKVLGAYGRASKRKCLNSGTGPSLPIWPTRRPAWPIILTTTIINAGIPVSAIQSLITFTSSYLLTSPNSLLPN